MKSKNYRQEYERIVKEEGFKKANEYVVRESIGLAQEWNNLAHDEKDRIDFVTVIIMTAAAKTLCAILESAVLVIAEGDKEEVLKTANAIHEDAMLSLEVDLKEVGKYEKNI